MRDKIVNSIKPDGVEFEEKPGRVDSKQYRKITYYDLLMRNHTR